MTTLPSPSSLAALPDADRAQVLDALFEPCPQLHTLSIATLGDNSFPDYPTLISTVGEQLTTLLEASSTSDGDWLDAILAAHPRLGDKKIDSEQSRREQAQLQGRQGDEDVQRLAELNQEYESTFSGLKYVSVALPLSSRSPSSLRYTSTTKLRLTVD
jgi:hypothetical protein